jgi:hypothetical protein
LFEKASVSLKNPKIKLLKIQLYRSKSGRYPGAIYISPTDKQGWYGRIETDGNLTLNQSNILPGLENDLRSFAGNPVSYVASFGKLTGNCCFCSLPLTDERSVEAGYGAICAQKFGLPYPEKGRRKKKEEEKFQPNQQLVDEITQELANFYGGSEQCYRHYSRAFNYSEGIKYLATKANCYWLLDAIASWQLSPKVKKSRMNEGFQIWELTRTTGNQAILTGAWDTDKIVVTQEIEYTDFPLPKIKLWLTDEFLCLPSEK